MEITKMGISNEGCCSSAAVVSPTSSSLLPLEKIYDFVPGYEYDVFLSFRGTDTRSGFTNSLYHSLRDAGLEVFRDDDELRLGEPIEKNLMEAINKSQISIAILSENYGGSNWCLKELVHMAECMHAGNQIIMPIFYNVSPRDVRHQSGSFGASFHSNNKKCNFSEETIRKWKETLMEVGNLKGRHVKDDSVDSEHEANEIKMVVDTVLRRLKKGLLVTGSLVGVENRVEEVMSMLNKDVKKVKIVGLYGMGGIGKTTLAKIIYNQLLSLNRFEGWSFLADVRETSQNKGMAYLQGQLISDILKKKVSESDNNVTDGRVQQVLSQKKLLVFLDDVSEADQCEHLIGDGSCLGEGSRIIITTRNKDILNAINLDRDDYEVTGLDSDHSLQLFSMHTLKKLDSPHDIGFEEYSKKVVELTRGLPLSLKVIGSLLRSKPISLWGDIIKKLEDVPEQKVEESLKISYNYLQPEQKKIFLDVACLFAGLDQRIVKYYWEDDGLFPNVEMRVLEDRSLLKIEENNTIWMHDLLIQLGKSIVREQGNFTTMNQSRVWDRKKAENILSNQNMKGEKIEAMITELNECGFTSDISKIVPNLTFLQVDDHTQLPDSFRQRLRTIRRDGKNPIILPQLRWLSWHSSNDRPVMLNMEWSSATNLVILDLSRNPLTHHWKGWSQIKVARNLKVLNLSGCENLTRTPNFSDLVSLEQLILRNCCNLGKIDKSIGGLKKLTFLDVSGCSNLRKLPKQLGHLKALTEIRIDRTGICFLVDPIGNVTSLEILSANKIDLIVLSYLSFARSLELKEIYIQSCRSVGEIPDDIGRLSHLTTLKITGFTQIGKVPMLPTSLIDLHIHFKIGGKDNPNEVRDLSNLVNLRELDLRLYFHEESPNLWSIGKLSNLVTLTLSTSTVVSCIALEDCLSSLCVLKKLRLTDCYRLEELPKLPPSLLYLYVIRCISLETFDVSDLEQLLELEVSRAAITEIHGLPSSLEKLCLKYCLSLQNLQLTGSSNSQLKRLIIYSCPMLQCPTSLPSSLQWLIIQHCPLITTVDAPKTLSYLCVNDDDFQNTSQSANQQLLGELSQLDSFRKTFSLLGYSPELLHEILVSVQMCDESLSELDSLRKSFSSFDDYFGYIMEFVHEIVGDASGIMSIFGTASLDINLFGSTSKRLENRMWNFIS